MPSNTSKIIGGVKVLGATVDDKTRCTHYHSERDIIAIKFKCCEQWFPCFECHTEFADHTAQVWKTEEFQTPAILCGACGHQLSIAEYFACDSVCPNCQSLFNPNCARHYYLYFESNA